MTQAEALLHDKKLRNAIVANAREYIETNHSEEAEHNAYSRLTTELCNIPRIDIEELAINVDDADEEFEEYKHRVRFQFKSDAKAAADPSTESADNLDTVSNSGCQEETKVALEAEGSEDVQTAARNEEQNGVVEGESLFTESSVDAGTREQISGSRLDVDECSRVPADRADSDCQTSSKSVISVASTAGEDAEQPVMIEDNSTSDASGLKLWINPVDLTAKAPSPRSPRVVALKADNRKGGTEPSLRRTTTKDSLQTAAPGKGGGTIEKNRLNQAATYLSNGAKKPTSKKTSPSCTAGADKTKAKPADAFRRTVGDTRPRAMSEPGSKPSPRSQKRRR